MTASWHGEAMGAEARTLSNLWRFRINRGCLDVTGGCLADWMRIRRTCVLVLDVCLRFTWQNEAWLQIASLSVPFPLEITQWCFFSTAHASIGTVREMWVWCPSALKCRRPLSFPVPPFPMSVPVSSLWSKSSVELLLLYTEPPEPLWRHHLKWLIIEFNTFRVVNTLLPGSCLWPFCAAHCVRCCVLCVCVC